MLLLRFAVLIGLGNPLDDEDEIIWVENNDCDGVDGVSCGKDYDASGVGWSCWRYMMWMKNNNGVSGCVTVFEEQKIQLVLEINVDGWQEDDASVSKMKIVLRVKNDGEVGG